jgi:hypothetical protein
MAVATHQIEINLYLNPSNGTVNFEFTHLVGVITNNINL